ncbi:MAG: HAD family hydrolase [Candidatus Omnitrophota bacterium]|jgi:phosphoglycolate phosphatase
MDNKKLAIFDLDGTLIDAYPAIVRSFNYTMRAFGYPAQKTLVIRRAVGWGDKYLLAPFVKKKHLSGALLVYRRHHKNALRAYAKTIPGAKRVLRYLRNKGYRLAVASNRPTFFSRILIRTLGLKQYFDFVLCADKLKLGKPHPEILEKILKKLHAEAKHTVYIGDMTIDAQAGRRAHIDTIIVTTGSSSETEIVREKPYRVISDIRGLLKILS